MYKTLLFILLIVTFHFAENCDKSLLKATHYKQYAKTFKSISTIEKIGLFKNVIDSFSNSKYSHFTNSCLFLKQTYQIKSINKFYKQLKKIENDSLLTVVHVLYSDYLISYGKKLIEGPFEGDTINVRIANEIRCLSQSDRIYEEAINILKTLKNWEQKPLCNTIINLEISRCGVYMKVGETFRRNMPSEILENSDGTKYILHDPEYDVTGMAESCYESLINKYGTYDCFKNNFKEIISKKLKELFEQQ